MSNLPMHILFKQRFEGWKVGERARDELELRATLEAPIPDEMPFEDEFLGYVDGQEVFYENR